MTAVNETSKRAFGPPLTVIDASRDPLKVLKLLMEGPGPNPKTGILFINFKGIPVARAHTPFDLIYMDEDLRVLQAAEISPTSSFQKFKGQPETALVLPPRCIHDSKTFTGDQIAIHVQMTGEPETVPARPAATKMPRVVPASAPKSYNVPASPAGAHASGSLLRGAGASIKKPASASNEEERIPAAIVESASTPTVAVPDASTVGVSPAVAAEEAATPVTAAPVAESPAPAPSSSVEAEEKAPELSAVPEAIVEPAIKQVAEVEKPPVEASVDGVRIEAEAKPLSEKQSTAETVAEAAPEPVEQAASLATEEIAAEAVVEATPGTVVEVVPEALPEAVDEPVPMAAALPSGRVEAPVEAPQAVATAVPNVEALPEAATQVEVEAPNTPREDPDEIWLAQAKPGQRGERAEPVQEAAVPEPDVAAALKDELVEDARTVTLAPTEAIPPVAPIIEILKSEEAVPEVPPHPSEPSPVLVPPAPTPEDQAGVGPPPSAPEKPALPAEPHLVIVRSQRPKNPKGKSFVAQPAEPDTSLASLFSAGIGTPPPPTSLPPPPSAEEQKKLEKADSLSKRWDVRLIYKLFPELSPEYRPDIEPPRIDPIKEMQKKKPEPKAPKKVRFLSTLYPDLQLDTVKDRQRRARRAPRIAVPGLVGYYFTGGKPVPYEIRNISVTGFYMLTTVRWSPGTIIRVTLQIADSDGENPADTITVHSRVVNWDRTGAGFEFVLPGFMEDDHK